MLTEERYNKILLAVESNSAVSVAELTEITDSSESTVRRDLAVLSKMGKLKKVHGGAVSVESGIIIKEPDMTEKEALNRDEKDKIAKYAAATVKNGDFVFIDAGTTTEKMISYITEKNAIFVTNAFVHAHLLAKKGLKVYMTGGEVKTSTEALVGVECVESLKRYNFTKCFLGTNGVSETAGFTTHNVDEASVKRTATNRSFMTFVLADSSKFEKSAAITFADIKNACIITDKLSDNKYKNLTVIKEVCK